MATVEVGERPVSGSDGAPAPEEAAGEELCKTPDRKHVDALLDISEEELLKELEPQEDICYGGWDEAVRGWARAAPLSCILVTQKDGKKPKQKESVDLPFPNAEASVTVGNTPDQLNQRAGSRSHAGGAGPLQSEASRWPSGAARRSPSQRLQGENTQELREAPAEIRPTKPQKAPHTSNTAVPIRQFIFLPPIVSPQLRPGMLGGGAKAPGGRSAEEKGLMLVQNSKMRGTRVGVVYPGAPADVCQSNPRLFSAISTSAQNSCVMAGASPCRAANCSRLSPGKKVVHLGGAAPRIPAMNPSKAACAVNL